MESTQLAVLWVPLAASGGVKRQGCESNKSAPCNVKVKAWERYTSTPGLEGVVHN
jgi:hypothetical protein